MHPSIETEATAPAPPASAVTPPIVAVFHSDAQAQAAVEAAGAEMIRNPSPGVVFLRPEPGLAARLYAAGAGVVVS